MKNSRRFVAGMSCLAMTLCIITGCTKHQTIDDGGYTYDEAAEGVPFEELPDDWTCPWCKHGKEYFKLQE